jgi:hypothetical protein
MKFLLLLVVLWVSLFSSIFNEKSNFKYLISINNETRGVLYLKTLQDYTEANYYGINKNDKILFYAKEKDFKVAKVFNNITLQKLNVDGIENEFLYDLSEVPEEIIEDSGLVQVDLKDSIIILDKKENTPAYTLPRKPIHTMDSLIKTLFFNKDILNKEFYLFEPQSSMLLKVAFSKDSKESIKIADKKCNTTVYTLSIVGKNKNLIHLYMSSVPLRIEAYSKKWSFDLIGAGEERRVTINKSKLITKLLRKGIESKYEKKYDLKDIDIRNKPFSNNYSVSYIVSKKIDEDLIKDFLPTYISEYRKYKSKKSTNTSGYKKDYYRYEVSFKDVIAYLENEKDVSIVDGKFYWKKVKDTLEKRKLQDFAAKKMGCKRDKDDYESVICKQKTKELDPDKKSKAKSISKKIDIEKMVSLYLKEKHPRLDYKKVEVDEESDTHYSVVTNEKVIITPRELSNAIKKVFKKEHKGLDTKYFDVRKNTKDKKYVVKIYKKDVANAACQDYLEPINTSKIRDSKIVYKNNRCYLKQHYTVKGSEANSIFDKYLKIKYPDLHYINVDKQINGDNVTFPYLSFPVGNPGVCND